MPKLSAGIIAYRTLEKNAIEILLVHPGGPFYKNKDDGAWSIPKGEYLQDEDALAAAKREFTEETGNTLPAGNYIPLRPVTIKSGKIISAWVVEASFEKTFIKSNFFEMEWPLRSGKKQSFPEVDKAEWFTLEDAAKKINAGQTDFIQQLQALLNK